MKIAPLFGSCWSLLAQNQLKQKNFDKVIDAATHFFECPADLGDKTYSPVCDTLNTILELFNLDQSNSCVSIEKYTEFETKALEIYPNSREKILKLREQLDIKLIWKDAMFEFSSKNLSKAAEKFSILTEKNVSIS